MSKEKPENNIVPLKSDYEDEEKCPLKKIGELQATMNVLEPKNTPTTNQEKSPEEISPAAKLIKDLICKGYDLKKIKSVLRDKFVREQYDIKKIPCAQTIEKIFNIEKRNLRNQYRADVLRKFIKFSKYSNELPDKKLQPKDPGYHEYKCRNNFWSAVSGYIQKLLKERFITDKEAVIKCEEFIKQANEKIDLSKATEEPSEDTSPEQIKVIDEIMQLVMEQLRTPEDEEVQNL